MRSSTTDGRFLSHLFLICFVMFFDIDLNLLEQNQRLQAKSFSANLSPSTSEKNKR